MIDIELLKSSIEGKGFISSVIYLNEIDSTNTYSKKKDIPLESLIIADYQSEGRGRQEKKWVSERNTNLTFSIKKKLPLHPSENHFAVFYFSYHLFKAVKKILTENLSLTEVNDIQIKWPNDILFNWKKLSGILIESVLPEGIYIIGIGLNCNQVKFPERLNAISLKQITGYKININELLIKIINEFSENFSEIQNKEYQIIYQNWKKSTSIIGKTCEFIVDSNHLKHGKIIDLNKDGSISIEFNKKVKNYHSGEIKLTAFN